MVRNSRAGVNTLKATVVSTPAASGPSSLIRPAR
jgi:hypothetical protein